MENATGKAPLPLPHQAWTDSRSACVDPPKKGSTSVTIDRGSGNDHSLMSEKKGKAYMIAMRQ
eukprot:scaffold14655_cov31-Tisochrysis_lutea.AAC.2